MVAPAKAITCCVCAYVFSARLFVYINIYLLLQQQKKRTSVWHLHFIVLYIGTYYICSTQAQLL